MVTSIAGAGLHVDILDRKVHVRTGAVVKPWTAQALIRARPHASSAALVARLAQGTLNQTLVVVDLFVCHNWVLTIIAFELAAIGIRSTSHEADITVLAGREISLADTLGAPVGLKDVCGIEFVKITCQTGCDASIHIYHLEVPWQAL